MSQARVEAIACVSLDAKFHSEIRCTIQISEKWLGKIVGIFMIYFQKAFDSIDYAYFSKKKEEKGKGGDDCLDEKLQIRWDTVGEEQTIWRRIL